MVQVKILINSYPRSGTSTLVDAIRMASTSHTLEFGEDFFHKNGWVSKSHLPILFLGSFPSDIIIGTVVRDPLDAISSNCFRWANGYTGNLVHGKIVVDKSREVKEDKFDDVLKSLIEHQIQQYISYYFCLNSNINNILIFEYEQIQNNVKEVIDKVVIAAGGNINLLNYDAAQYVIQNPSQPTKEKTELYYQIRDYILSSTEINKCYDLYNKILKTKENQNV